MDTSTLPIGNKEYFDVHFDKFSNDTYTYIHNLHILYVVSYYQVTQRSEVVEFDAHMFNGGIINSGKIEKHIYELRPLRKNIILHLISVFYKYLFSSTHRRQKS